MSTQNPYCENPEESRVVLCYKKENIVGAYNRAGASPAPTVS